MADRGYRAEDRLDTEMVDATHSSTWPSQAMKCASGIELRLRRCSCRFRLVDKTPAMVQSQARRATDRSRVSQRRQVRRVTPECRPRMVIRRRSSAACREPCRYRNQDGMGARYRSQPHCPRLAWCRSRRGPVGLGAGVVPSITASAIAAGSTAARSGRHGAVSAGAGTPTGRRRSLPRWTAPPGARRDRGG
jgi:hypothetical protein